MAGIPDRSIDLLAGRWVAGLVAVLSLLFAGFGVLMCAMASESLVVGGPSAKWGWLGFAALVTHAKERAAAAQKTN